MNFEENLVRQVINPYIQKKIYYSGELLFEHTVLNIPKDTDLVILNQSFENNLPEQQLKILKEKVGNTDCVLLTSNYQYYKNKHPNIIYFPYYFFYIHHTPGLRKFDIASTRPHKLLSLNLNPWLHRTVNFLEMRKRTWFSECQHSFHWTYKFDNVDTTHIGEEALAGLKDNEKQELEKLTFPILIDNNFRSTWYASNANDSHGSCYINYVTENSVSQNFITEKVWKPILSGQLFLILGPQLILKHLKDLGLDTFDDIIDSSYDQETEFRIKIDMILGQLDRLMGSDLNRLWIQTYERRKRNCELLYDPQFQLMLAQDLISRVS